MTKKGSLAWGIPLVLGIAIGFFIAGNLGKPAEAQDAEPRGRTPVAIEKGVYPATYFPNTELLGPAEMRITALGTGMPNQTKSAVSISYLVELGNEIMLTQYVGNH